VRKALGFALFHLYELAAAAMKSLQFLRGCVRHGPQGGTDAFGEERERACVEPVGLGQKPQAARKIPAMAGVDPHGRQTGAAKGEENAALITARRFQHDPFGTRKPQPGDQRAMTGGVIGERKIPTAIVSADANVNLIFRDVASDMARWYGHLCLYLVLRASKPRQLFEVEQTKPAGDLAEDGVTSAKNEAASGRPILYLTSLTDKDEGCLCRDQTKAGLTAPAGRQRLARRHHHHDLAAFLFRKLLDLGDLVKIVLHAL
jgi:hypothetical protein